MNPTPVQTPDETIVVQHGDLVNLGEFSVQAQFGEGNACEFTPEEFEEMKRGLLKAIRKQIAADRVMESVSRSSGRWAERLIRQLNDTAGLLAK